MKIIILILITFFSLGVFSQGTNCYNSTPFCTGTTYSFPSVTGNSGYGSVSCLGSTPNPTWFHFQIANPGNMTIRIQQGSNDVDFICWGPFTSATGACGNPFPSGPVESCSYSASATEYCQITGANTGEWYILLITNYSGSPGNFVFTNTGGNATTNCCILSGTDAGNPFTKTCVSNSSGATIGTSPTSGSTYSWTPAAGLSNPNISNPVANPISTTTYTLQEIDASGCVFTDQVTVTVNTAPPNANAGSDVTINCAIPTTTLNASGGVSYSWSPTAGLSNPNIRNPVANPSSTTTYTVTVTGSNGCTATDQVTITVDKAPPTANAGADVTTTCITPTAQLNGSGGVSYSWSPSTGLSNANVFNPVANPSTTTIYTLTAMAANGCTDTDQVTVTVDETPPSVNAGSDFTITCTTPSVTLSGSGSGTYSWSPSNGLSGTTIATPVATPASTTTYTLTVTALNGCTATDQVVISVDKTPPNTNAGSDITLDCITTSGVFNATGGVSFLWTRPDGSTATTASLPVSDTDPAGYYVVEGTGSNGCTKLDSALLTIDQTPPNASAGADVILDCATSSGTFTATGGVTYAWVTPSGGTNSSSTINVTFSDPVGDYVVTIAAPNGCVIQDTAMLIVDTIVPVVNAGIDTLLTCSHMSIDLNGTQSDTGSIYSNVWTTYIGHIVTGTTTLTPTVDSVGNYFLTITNTVNHCVNSDTVYVGIDTIHPVAVAGVDTIISCNIPEINLSGTGSSTGNYTYLWTTLDGNITMGDNTLSPTVNQGGNYTLLVTNNYNGCTDNDQVFVAEDLTAVVDILVHSVSVDTIYGVAPDSVDYSWVGDNGTVQWDFGDNNFSTDSSLMHIYNLRGDYMAYIILTDERGCVAYDSIYVFVDGREIRFPNIFTPNGDGVNDIFTFKAERITEFECVIFNRWGQVVYSWTAPVGGWDGRTLAGKESPTGEYYYILKAIDRDGKSIERKGNLMLTR